MVALFLVFGFYGCEKQHTSEVLSPESEAVSLENETFDLLTDAGFGFGRMYWISSEILNLTPAQQERREAMKEHFRKVDALIREILNPQQLEKYEALKLKRERKRAHFQEDKEM
jgi:hypothetical protein